MENYSDFEVEEDALSLCDLSLNDQNDNDDSSETRNSPYSSDPQDFFEFKIDPIYGYVPMDVVFCGKSISCSKPITAAAATDPQIENPFFSRSESFRFSPSSARSSSHRLPCTDAPAAVNYRSQSSNSRKHKVLIGLVKYQPAMDISELRKRQARRSPAPIIPASGGGGEVAVAGGKSGGKGGHWWLIRPLRCRSHLLSAWARATLGCVPRVTV